MTNSAKWPEWMVSIDPQTHNPAVAPMLPGSKAFFSMARVQGKTVYAEIFGLYCSTENVKEFLTQFTDLQTLIIQSSEEEEYIAGTIGEYTSIYLHLTGGEENYLDVTILTLYKDILEAFREIKKLKTKEKEICDFYIVSRNINGFQLRSLNQPGQEIIPTNYSPLIVSQFNQAAEILKSKEPKGRLVILTGSPGTGKSHMVRGFVHTCSGQPFVIVPPHLVVHLSDPDFLEFLMNTASDYEKLTLVIEDADSVMENRAIDNMSAISTMLNLTDGVLGESMDLRVVATSNTSVGKIDEALKRPGRLASHIHLGKLSQEQSQGVLDRLCGKTLPETREYTLAELYQLGNGGEG